MSDNDSIKRKEFRQLKGVTSFFDKEALPEAQKEINEILEELDRELAKNKKIIAERDRIMLETMSYEELKQLANSVRLSLGFDVL